MKVNLLRKLAVLLSLAMTCGLGVAQAENVKLASYWSEEANAALAESNEAASAGGACCGSSCCDAGNSCCGGGSCCDSCCDCGGCRLPAVSEGCPLLNIIGFAGLDTWKTQADTDWPSQFGVVNGVNAAAPLPGLSRYGIGGQLGASYGIYDLQGRETGGDGDRGSSQEQLFITSGFFRRADAQMPFNLGVAYDAMINDNFGEDSNEPYLGQWRGLIGFCLSARNEIGWWGAFHDRRDTQDGITYRTVQQNNMYWHHNFLGGADSWLWVGIPERNRLTGDGNLYEWNLGGLVNVPLTARTGLYGSFAYFCPSAPAGTDAAVEEEAYQLGMGLSIFLGATSRNASVAGRTWAPLMPMANNGNMVVDTNGAN